MLRDTSPPELWELRLTLEPAIARMAALRATPDQLAAIARIHAAADPARFDLEGDIAFHRAVAEASGNSLFAWLVDAVTGFTRDGGFRMQLPAFTEETGWRRHDAILSAIQRRSPAEAEAAMRAHHEAIHRWLSGFSD
ncbi:FadR/GntR family transcriptional regulator [Rhodovulum sp. DZ06]|uniref:FadR/GntR family transcriptional regulator n=1 Tax=Rhodovulum sp. DZ06 TaxID=3425126 RepID=UPI003D34C1C7